MNQDTKERIIGKIRTSSFVIGIFCVLLAVYNALLAFGRPLGLLSADTGKPAQAALLRTEIASGFGLVIMLLSAVVFFRMSQSGRPFTRRIIRIVLLIAVLLLLKAIIPTAILAADIGSGIKGIFSLLGESSLLESVLFLFAALIMHYASLLQQASDETL